MSLDEEAAAMERRPGISCGVCRFIDGQADWREWDELLAGPRTASAVHAVMRRHGYAGDSHQAIANHRRAHHRAVAP